MNTGFGPSSKMTIQNEHTIFHCYVKYVTAVKMCEHSGGVLHEA